MTCEKCHTDFRVAHGDAGDIYKHLRSEIRLCCRFKFIQLFQENGFTFIQGFLKLLWQRRPELMILCKKIIASTGIFVRQVSYRHVSRKIKICSHKVRDYCYKYFGYILTRNLIGYTL